MKKLVVLLVVGVFFVSCEETSQEKRLISRQKEEMEIKKNFQILVIDDCEYILSSSVISAGNTGYFAHKGNCKNPIHCHNQHKKENKQ